LLDTITELSAPGSWLATESTPSPQPGDDDRMKEHMRDISERWGAQGFDPDMAGLVYFGKRNEAAPYLSARGWTLTEISIRELFTANGLQPLKDDIRFGDTLFVSGTLNKTTTKRAEAHLHP
jgi:O-methyltransferase involved in polyketide biosynthesis